MPMDANDFTSKDYFVTLNSNYKLSETSVSGGAKTFIVAKYTGISSRYNWLDNFSKRINVVLGAFGQ